MKDEVLVVRNQPLANTISSLITSMIDYNDNSKTIRFKLPNDSTESTSLRVTRSLEQVSWDINLHDKVRKAQFSDIFPELNFLKTTK